MSITILFVRKIYPKNNFENFYCDKLIYILTLLHKKIIILSKPIIMKRYIINAGNEYVALKINARGKKLQFNVETKVSQQKKYLCAQWLLDNQVEIEILSFISGHWRISMGYARQWSRVYNFVPQKPTCGNASVIVYF